jgi:hypothetical protein
MFSSSLRRTGAAAAASLVLLGLGACGDDETTTSSTTDTGQSSAAATSKETPSTPTTTEDAAASTASSGDHPKWAQTPTSGGEKISTIKAGDLTVDVFQVGTTKATKNGQFADPDTNKPILAKGDEIVFVNYVITNTGDPIDLGSSLVDITPRYKDWKYLQGMDSIVDDTLFEEQGVNDDSLAPGAFKDPSVYTLGKGQSYSYGENFKYQKDSPITFEVKATPVDAKGELLHDEAIEGKGTGTIS